MYKISIVMPIFNAEKYIERSFKSILNQTMDLNDIEVIMVDDNSTDNTSNIVKEYENRYSNFKAIYHEKNSGGCAIPRNSGLKVASGKYIMFLDPDDEYALDMCETLYDKIEEKKVDIVKCNIEMVYPTFSRQDYSYDRKKQEITIDCNNDLPTHTSSVCNAIHRKKFLDDNNLRFKNLKNAEDIIFSLTEFLNTNTLIYLNNYHGYKYYFNEELSHSMRPTKDNLDAILSSFYLTKDLIESKNRPDILQYIFSNKSIGFFLRLINYEGDKIIYLKKFYEFEKSLNINLKMNHLWLAILNKLIMKKKFTLSSLYLNILQFIRNGPLLKLYRKTL